MKKNILYPCLLFFAAMVVSFAAITIGVDNATLSTNKVYYTQILPAPQEKTAVETTTTDKKSEAQPATDKKSKVQQKSKTKPAPKQEKCG